MNVIMLVLLMSLGDPTIIGVRFDTLAECQANIAEVLKVAHEEYPEALLDAGCLRPAARDDI